MKDFIRCKFVMFCLVAGLLCMTGCNTWRGAGKDVEKAGDAMQGK